MSCHICWRYSSLSPLVTFFYLVAFQILVWVLKSPCNLFTAQRNELRASRRR
ncbi:hypothetical protein DL95DRAFT_503975 [Leptodontidium sp. 2 PMI_412]|nr:hypothetical protein DL95DRAFT_503975 [Leptodontidium sp. 2 PMI_412]